MFKDKILLITGGTGFFGNAAHKKFWKEYDILDVLQFKKIITDFSPTHVVYLAAKTGLNEKKLSEFAANIEGVENLIQILKAIPFVEQVVFTSSLLVCRMGYVPKYDTDYQPTTLYGESKVEGEKVVWAHKDLPFAWTIIRPILIWGPWITEPFTNFFKLISKGLYFHIGSGHCFCFY